jgi:hypothetical protein
LAKPGRVERAGRQHGLQLGVSVHDLVEFGVE